MFLVASSCKYIVFQNLYKTLSRLFMEGEGGAQGNNSVLIGVWLGKGPAGCCFLYSTPSGYGANQYSYECQCGITSQPFSISSIPIARICTPMIRPKFHWYPWDNVKFKCVFWGIPGCHFLSFGFPCVQTQVHRAHIYVFGKFVSSLFPINEDDILDSSPPWPDPGVSVLWGRVEL